MKNKIDIFKVLGEKNRVRILLMLLQKPLCVCEITSVLNLNTSTVSNHLALLRDAGFVVDEKEGKWINYKINHDYDSPIISEILSNIYDWFSDEKQIQDDLLKIKSVDRYYITQIGKS